MTTEEIPALNEMSIMRMPAQLDTIEEEAFEGLNIEAVIIPTGCTTIGPRAFADCTQLKYVWIPKSATDIADNAFDGCDNVVLDYEQ